MGVGCTRFWFSRELIGAGTNEKSEGGSSWSPPSAVHEHAQFFWGGGPREREGGQGRCQAPHPGASRRRRSRRQRRLRPSRHRHATANGGSATAAARRREEGDDDASCVVCLACPRAVAERSAQRSREEDDAPPGTAAPHTKRPRARGEARAPFHSTYAEDGLVGEANTSTYLSPSPCYCAVLARLVKTLSKNFSQLGGAWAARRRDPCPAIDGHHGHHGHPSGETLKKNSRS